MHRKSEDQHRKLLISRVGSCAIHPQPWVVYYCRFFSMENNHPTSKRFVFFEDSQRSTLEERFRFAICLSDKWGYFLQESNVAGW
jgi:hypothetical protein